jgi:hypothetical protein
MSAFRGNADILPGLHFITDGLAFSRLAQGACRGMGAVAEVAYVIHGPALAFRIISTSSCQLWVPCFSSTRSGILRASRLGMVEALATSALSAGVARLENGLDCSSALLTDRAHR